MEVAFELGFELWVGMISPIPFTYQIAAIFSETGSQ